MSGSVAPISASSNIEAARRRFLACSAASCRTGPEHVAVSVDRRRRSQRRGSPGETAELETTENTAGHCHDDEDGLDNLTSCFLVDMADRENVDSGRACENPALGFWHAITKKARRKHLSDGEVLRVSTKAWQGMKKSHGPAGWFYSHSHIKHCYVLELA